MVTKKTGTDTKVTKVDNKGGASKINESEKPKTKVRDRFVSTGSDSSDTNSGGPRFHTGVTKPKK